MEILVSKEQGLLNIFRDVFPFLELRDIATISSLNKSFINLLSQHPVALIYMLRAYYLNDQDPHPNKRKYFKKLLRRVNADTLHCAERELAIIINAKNRIDISSNLIRTPKIDRDMSWGPPTAFTSVGWKIIRNGGHGWIFQNVPGQKYRNYALATSFFDCEMIYSVPLDDFGKGFMAAFLADKAVIKAGCFMSRRRDCGSRGGCDLIVSTKEGQIVLRKEAKRSNNELTPFKWIQVINEVKYDEIKQYMNLELYLSLKIYGRDERFWAGHYGAKFSSMYIRGDYINSE